MALLAPSVNFQKLSKTTDLAKKGVTTANKSIQNISQVVFKRTKVKREIFTQTKMLRTRRVETERRKQLEDEIGAVDTLQKPGGAQNLAQADNSKGFFQRLIGFVGYLTAGWLLNNLPTLLGIGKEFIARLQRAGQLLSGFFNNTIQLFANFGNVMGALGQNIASFDFLDSSNRLRSSFDQLNSTIAGLGAQIEEAFGLVTTPLTQGKYSGEQIPGFGTEITDEGAYNDPGTSGQGGKLQPIHKQALDIIAGPESGGDYNAMNNGQAGDRPGGSKKWLGKNLTDMSIGEVKQYQNVKKTLWAAGRYQIIPGSLISAQTSAGLKDNDRFDQNNQDLLAMGLLKTQGPGAWTKYSKYTKEQIALMYKAKNTPLGKPTQQNIQSPSKPSIVTAGSSQYTSGTADTGGGFTPDGAKDVYGRPVVLSRSAAEAFAAMMRDSGGIVKGSDVASSQRSFEKNVKVGGAIKSKHLKGLALDIHGPSNAWMRKYGARYGWYAYDYSGSHGGHFEFKGGTSPGVVKASPAQISAPPQQRISYPAGITPERRGQDIIIAQPPSQQNVIMGGGGGGGDTGQTPASNFMMLNNFIKNKLLLDLAYL